MKKSTKVTLTVVAVMGMAGCNRHRDPCTASTFDAAACENAVREGGYYWGGHWYGMTYGHPYPYYYDSYRSHVSSGGRVTPPPSGSYARPASGPGKQFGTGGSTPSGSSVQRGGFGSTGSGHSSGSSSS
jgi:hypothetical protein